MSLIPRRDFNACVARYKGDYRCLTNHLGYEALTIAELYRECWNVELFFYDKHFIMQSNTITSFANPLIV